jgi:hypothetical protein
VHFNDSVHASQIEDDLTMRRCARITVAPILACADGMEFELETAGDAEDFLYFGSTRWTDDGQGERLAPNKLRSATRAKSKSRLGGAPFSAAGTTLRAAGCDRTLDVAADVEPALVSNVSIIVRSLFYETMFPMQKPVGPASIGSGLFLKNVFKHYRFRLLRLPCLSHS